MKHYVLAGALCALSMNSPRAEDSERFAHQPAARSSPSRDLVSIARSHEGKRAAQLGLPRSLWCADFMNLVRREGGLKPVPSRMARDQVLGGTRLREPRPGAIVTLSGRGRAVAHTGIVAAVLPGGDILVVSGNHGHRVAESVYPRGRIVALVDPS